MPWKNASQASRCESRRKIFPCIGSSIRPSSETALLIDVSYSMLMNDALHAGKKVALALHRLIQTKYPQDTLAPGRVSFQC